MNTSPFADHVKLAIRIWARDRARQFKDAAAKAPNMEDFLTELLLDSLLTFNAEYNRAYEEHVARMERLLEESVAYRMTPPIAPRDPEAPQAPPLKSRLAPK